MWWGTEENSEEKDSSSLYWGGRGFGRLEIQESKGKTGTSENCFTNSTECTWKYQ